MHMVLLLLSGLAYYDDPPWLVPTGEAGGFLAGTAVLALLAVIPIVTGVQLIRGRVWVPREGQRREQVASTSEGEQLVPR